MYELINQAWVSRPNHLFIKVNVTSAWTNFTQQDKPGAEFSIIEVVACMKSI